MGGWVGEWIYLVVGSEVEEEGVELGGADSAREEEEGEGGWEGNHLGGWVGGWDDVCMPRWLGR